MVNYVMKMGKNVKMMIRWWEEQEGRFEEVRWLCERGRWSCIGIRYCERHGSTGQEPSKRKMCRSSLRKGQGTEEGGIIIKVSN